MTARSLIDDALVEIAKGYKAGLLRWIRIEYRPQWREMLGLEDTINRAALTGNKEGLTAALQSYKVFFREMVRLFEEAEGLPLFGGMKEDTR
jgi:hypothetical protein